MRARSCGWWQRRPPSLVTSACEPANGQTARYYSPSLHLASNYPSDLSGDLSHGMNRCAAGHFVSQTWTMSHDLIFGYVVPDGQQVLLTCNGHGHDPVE